MSASTTLQPPDRSATYIVPVRPREKGAPLKEFLRQSTDWSGREFTASSAAFYSGADLRKVADQLDAFVKSGELSRSYRNRRGIVVAYYRRRVRRQRKDKS